MPLTPLTQRAAQKQEADCSATLAGKGKMMNTTSKKQSASSKTEAAARASKRSSETRFVPSRAWAEQHGRVVRAKTALNAVMNERKKVDEKIQELYNDKDALWKARKSGLEVKHSAKTTDTEEKRTQLSEAVKERDEFLAEVNGKTKELREMSGQMKKIWDDKYAALFKDSTLAPTYEKLQTISRQKWGGPHIRFVREREEAEAVFRLERETARAEVEKMKLRLKALRENLKKAREVMKGTLKKESDINEMKRDSEAAAQEHRARVKKVETDIGALKKKRDQLYEQQRKAYEDREALIDQLVKTAEAVWAEDSWWHAMSKKEQEDWRFLTDVQRQTKKKAHIEEMWKTRREVKDAWWWEKTEPERAEWYKSQEDAKRKMKKVQQSQELAETTAPTEDTASTVSAASDLS